MRTTHPSSLVTPVVTHHNAPQRTSTVDVELLVYNNLGDPLIVSCHRCLTEPGRRAIVPPRSLPLEFIVGVVIRAATAQMIALTRGANPHLTGRAPAVSGLGTVSLGDAIRCNRSLTTALWGLTTAVSIWDGAELLEACALWGRTAEAFPRVCSEKILSSEAARLTSPAV